MPANSEKSTTLKPSFKWVGPETAKVHYSDGSTKLAQDLTQKELSALFEAGNGNVKKK